MEMQGRAIPRYDEGSNPRLRTGGGNLTNMPEALAQLKDAAMTLHEETSVLHKRLEPILAFDEGERASTQLASAPDGGRSQLTAALVATKEGLLATLNLVREIQRRLDI